MNAAYSDKNQATNSLIAESKSDSAYSVVGSALVAEQITIPAGAKYVSFSFSIPVWADLDNPSISVPSVTSSVAGTVEYNPVAWSIPDGFTTVDIISESSFFGTVIFHA